MKYLLDTHVVIWWMQNSRKLSRVARRIIERDDCVVSVLSILERAAKHLPKRLIEV